MMKNPKQTEQSEQKQNEKTRKIISIAALTVVILVAVAATILLFPYVVQLADEEKRQAFEEMIRSFGTAGFVIVLLIQIAQVIFAVIPGEPVELVIGALYGTVPGCLICLAGVALGTLVIYSCVKKFGRNFVDKFINSAGFEKFKFLHDPSRRDVLLFLLFFIPGTPKDILTYFAPFTGIPLLRFLIISTLARIPSIITSTYVGANLIEGNYIVAICAFAIVGVISLAGIWVYNRILKKENR